MLKSLEVQSRTLKGKDPLKRLTSQFLYINVYGHEGIYEIYEGKKGFLRRKSVDVLRICFYCDKTNRSLELKFRGYDVKEHFPGILSYIGGSKCH